MVAIALNAGMRQGEIMAMKKSWINLKEGLIIVPGYSQNRILKKAGLEGKPGVDKLRFHDLRHTATTNLGRSGKDIKFIAQYLGHKDRYTWLM